MWPTGSSPPPPAATSWPTRPGMSVTPATCSTGASNAHVAILLVDARAGVLRQTRRHARIANLLGIKHFGGLRSTRSIWSTSTAAGSPRSRVSCSSFRPARRPRSHRHPDRRQARRQRGAPLAEHPLVHRARPARVPRSHRPDCAACRSGEPAAGCAVGVPADVGAASPDYTGRTVGGHAAGR